MEFGYLKSLTNLDELLIPIVKKVTTIGRSKNCDIKITKNKYVSAKHCSLEVDESNIVWLKDTSSNGLIVKGKRKLRNEKIKLDDGDVFQLVHKTPEFNVNYKFQKKSSSDVATTPVGDHDNDAQEISDHNNDVKEVEIKETKDGSSQGSNVEDKMGELLTCIICHEVFHNCISLMPCMHSFCDGCYSAWWQKNGCCPSCRANVENTSSNHLIKKLVETYLTAHPDMKRNGEELKKLDLMSEIRQKAEPPNSKNIETSNINIQNISDDDDDVDDDDIDNADDDFLFSGDVDDDYDDDEDDVEDDIYCGHNMFYNINDYNLNDDDDVDDDTYVGYISDDNMDYDSSDNNDDVDNVDDDGDNVDDGGDNVDDDGDNVDDDGGVKYTKAKSQTPKKRKRSFKIDDDDDDDADRNLLKIPRTQCRQCKQRKNALNQPGSSRQLDFVCGPHQPHIICNCCIQNMPEHGHGSAFPPQKCGICSEAFCHLYWGCSKPSCLGCLGFFRDLTFPNSTLDTLILGNVFESNILKRYLQSKNISSDQFFKDLINQCYLETLPCPDANAIVTRNEPICRLCALNNLKELAYCFRMRLTEEDLNGDGLAIGRPDCYWGRNCRTQISKPSHAKNYNHICEQTRF